uniref:Uncharacterized protein n=1 Tax=Ditylenchus dipsaci TaxID=166011 RepID=A0A915D783_9BILA
MVFVCFFKKKEEKATRLIGLLGGGDYQRRKKGLIKLPVQVGTKIQACTCSVVESRLLKSEDIRDARVCPSTTPVKVLALRRWKPNGLGEELRKAESTIILNRKFSTTRSAKGKNLLGLCSPLREFDVSAQTPSSSPANSNNSSGAGDPSPSLNLSAQSVSG